jgi:HlyD family secretion protein
VKKLLIVFILIGASLAGVVYWLNAPRRIHIREELFNWASVSKGQIQESVSATGSVKPKDLVVLTSEGTGTVQAVLVDVNGIVKEGETLVKLDNRLAQLKVEQAEIGVQTAQAALEQTSALQNAAEKALKYQRDLEKSGFRKDLEKAEIELEAAKASVRLADAKLQNATNQHKQAQYTLQLTELKVPIQPGELSAATPSVQPVWVSTGAKKVSDTLFPQVTKKREFLVLERNVKIGQLVGPMTPAPLFVLAGNLSRMEVHTEIVEGDIGRVKPAQLVRFSISSYDDPDLKFVGTVREIMPTPNNVKGAVYYNAVIDVINQKNVDTGEWRLLPGMTASVDIVVQKRESAWRVPLAALNVRMDDAYLTQAAAERLSEWERRLDAGDWRPVWTWQASHERVWPVFVRLKYSAKNVKGLQNGEFHQVLEWEPGAEPNPTGPDLRVITGAPPAHEPGLLERPAPFKMS